MGHALNKHAHILFDEGEYKYLKKLSRSQKRTVGELVRLAVRKVYGKKEDAYRKTCGESLLTKNDLRVSDWEEMEKELLHRYG